MARVLMPLLSSVASGQWLHQTVYQKNGRIRLYVVPTNPQTAEQQEKRHRFGDVQLELSAMGGDLRAVCREWLGYRWHTAILHFVLRRDHQEWGRLASRFGGFSAAEKDAWAVYDTALGLVHDRGLCFFVAASAARLAVLRAGGPELFDEPVGSNALDIGMEWPTVLELIVPWTDVTFENGWENYGSPFQSGQFCKDALGFVHLRGVVRNGTLSAVAFVLPDGCRPGKTEEFLNTHIGGSGYFSIEPTGDVKLLDVNDYQWLSGATFYAGF